uniref:Uncharacterized protein n=1 Tax=Arion vulgaris TaxID=1028688 RepID=A0A0B7B1U0_9EUPU
MFAPRENTREGIFLPSSDANKFTAETVREHKLDKKRNNAQTYFLPIFVIIIGTRSRTGNDRKVYRKKLRKKSPERD